MQPALARRCRVVASTDSNTFQRLYADLTALHEELFPESGSDATQLRVRRYLRDNETVIRESFYIWRSLGQAGRSQLLGQHRQLDETAVDDRFVAFAEEILENALAGGPLLMPVTDDDVNVVRRVVNYAAHSPDADRSDVALQRDALQ
jgi:hypothetical protein